MNFISHSDKEREEILSAIGVEKFEDLISNIPREALFSSSPNGLLKKGVSEIELLSHLKALASENRTVEDFPSFLGAGAYHHFIPSVVNAIISRGEFLTAYTPYQPEASQGTLQATFEFQTMISELYGMDVANASLYDGASAMAEAVLLALRETGRKRILISKTVHPEYRLTTKTYCKDVEIIEISHFKGTTLISELEKKCDERVACVVIQNPNFFGQIEDGKTIGEIAHKNGALFIVSANPVPLSILASPGEYGADIAVGEGQPLGVSLNYGGPYLGLFACKERLMRKMPGRVVGMTKDLDGKRGFVLTLQTREQHIRREKATSNICTNEALMALASTVYLSLLGFKGLRECAELNLQKAHYAFEQISKLSGFSPAFNSSPFSHSSGEEPTSESMGLPSPFFNEFVIRSKIEPEKIQKELLKNKIIGGLPLGRFYPELSDSTLFCVTEMNSKEQIDLLVHTLQKISS